MTLADTITATNFTAIDGVIVAVYLAVTAGIGMALNRYIHNVGDYMVGGRASGAALNAATYIGTGLGLVTLMYASIDGFNHGFSYMTLGLIGLIVSLFLGSTGFVVGRLRQMRLTTIPEFFQARFDVRVRILGGAICALAGILNMGLFPKMGATFITYVTGLGGGENETALLVNIVTTALVALVLAYTVIGGMVSVIITDYIQFVVLSIGMGIGLWFCFQHEGLGWQPMIDAMSKQHGEAAFNPVHSESYGWVWVIWMIFVIAAAYIAWSPEATRALTSKGTKSTRLTFLLASPSQFIRLAMPALWAIAAFTLFSQHDEMAAFFYPNGMDGDPENVAAAMPLLLGKIIPSGLLGLLVAGLMAAFMSTHDSYLLSWSSIIVRDVLDPVFGGTMTDRQQIRWTRGIIIAIGVFLVSWGIWYPLPDSVWSYMAVTGTIYLSGAGVVIIGGMYWRPASSAGAMAALLGGLIAAAGLFVDRIYDSAYRVENFAEMSKTELTGLMGVGNFVFCALLMVAFSLLMPDAPKHRDNTDNVPTETGGPEAQA